jgi:nicotinamidase-related amidase
MPAKNSDLHGNAPDKSPVALLLIDVINDLEFDGGEQLRRCAEPMAECIARLKREAAQLGIPSIYVNDNFGRWRSNFASVLDHCLKDGVRGEAIARTLRPEPDDYFVLKPKHSGFYSTTLDVLLRYLGAETLVLTGMTTDACVLFTAHDAFLRDYRLFVPSDCVAAIDTEENRRTLRHMERVLKADVRPAADIDLQALLASRTPARAAEA